MVFSRQLVEGIRRGRIKCSIRFWTRPHVKVDGRYPLGDGQIVVESITPIEMSDVTHDLARESGFESVQALLDIARHGKGRTSTSSGFTTSGRAHGMTGQVQLP